MIRTDRVRRNQNKYCNFYKDIDHDTKDCIQLRDQIELLGWDGHLREIVEKGIIPTSAANRAGQVWAHAVLRTSDRTNTGELEHIIYTIFGGMAISDTTSSRRSYASNARQVTRGNTSTWLNTSYRSPTRIVS